MSQAKLENPILRWTVALAGAGFLCLWASLHYRRAALLDNWESQSWEQRYPDVSESPSLVPARSASLVEAANFFSREIMPPDRRLARKLLLRAVPLSPMGSPIWLALAEQDIFLGSHDEAKAALLHADRLDPSYPDQRLAAVQLWTLLGDRERALGLAAKVASLDGEGRDEAAQALLRAGYPGDEIMRELKLETLKPQELTGVLNVLANASAEKQRAIMAKIPATTLDDEAFRQSAARAFSNPPDPSIVSRIWQRQVPDLQTYEVAGGTILADNLNLARAPFASPFWFGWQSLPEASPVGSAWVPHTQTPEDFSQVRLDFSSIYERDSRALRWTFYRLPVPPLSEPLAIDVAFRSVPPEFSRCRLMVRNRTESFPGREYQSLSPDWGKLTAIVPPSAKPRLLEIQLERGRRGNSKAHEVSLFVGPMTLRTATAKDLAP